MEPHAQKVPRTERLVKKMCKRTKHLKTAFLELWNGGSTRNFVTEGLLSLDYGLRGCSHFPFVLECFSELSPLACCPTSSNLLQRTVLREEEGWLAKKAGEEIWVGWFCTAKPSLVSLCLCAVTYLKRCRGSSRRRSGALPINSNLLLLRPRPLCTQASPFCQTSPASPCVSSYSPPIPPHSLSLSLALTLSLSQVIVDSHIVDVVPPGLPIQLVPLVPGLPPPRCDPNGVEETSPERVINIRSSRNAVRAREGCGDSSRPCEDDHGRDPEPHADEDGDELAEASGAHRLGGERSVVVSGDLRREKGEKERKRERENKWGGETERKAGVRVGTDNHD